MEHVLPKSRRSPPAVPPAPPLSAIRRLATARDFGAPVQLVLLLRAPPPVHIAAGKMWINAPTRKVTVVAGLGDVKVPRRFLVVRRTHAWVAYDDDGNYTSCVVTTGPLDPRERDIIWAWGWKSKSAKALRVMEALR